MVTINSLESEFFLACIKYHFSIFEIAFFKIQISARWICEENIPQTIDSQIISAIIALTLKVRCNGDELWAFILQFN